MWVILAVGLFHSIIFPTIFSMSLHELGPAIGQGSGLLCMTIVSGAIVPFGQGWLAGKPKREALIPVAATCYLYIRYYGFKYRNLCN